MNNNKKDINNFNETINDTRKLTFDLITEIERKSKINKVDIVSPLQHIVDIVVDRLLFDGFSPEIINNILTDSLKWTVDCYADRLKKSINKLDSSIKGRENDLKSLKKLKNLKFDKKLLN